MIQLYCNKIQLLRGMPNLKRFSLLLLVFLFIPLTAFANTDENNSDSSNSYDISVEFPLQVKVGKEESEKSLEEPTIQPLQTFYGNGGTSGLDWGAAGRTITWRIKPATLEPWVFTGKLTIYYNDRYWRSYDLSGGGALGSTLSDTIELPYMYAGEYEFHLSGTAVAPLGNIDFYTVDDDAVLYLNKTYNS